MTNSLKSRRGKDKFQRAAERIVDRMDTDSANYYPTTMIRDLTAALRRVDRAARKKAYQEGFNRGFAKHKYLTECAKQAIAAEQRGEAMFHDR